MGVGRARLFRDRHRRRAAVDRRGHPRRAGRDVATAVLTSIVRRRAGLPLEPSTPDARWFALAALASGLCGIVDQLLAGQACDDARHGRRPAWSRRHRSAFAGSSRFVLTTQVALSMILVVGAGLLRHDAVESVCQRPADSRQSHSLHATRPHSGSTHAAAAAVFSESAGAPGDDAGRKRSGVFDLLPRLPRLL